MARRRFAVALIIEGPAAIEIDALRRALGDDQLGVIDPHITLIPPINLRDDEIVEAMAVVDAVASSCGPCSLTLGPVESFAPSGRARYLRVAPWEPVVAVKDACWTGPFDRPQRRDFHPHVTIDIGGHEGEGDDPVLDELGGYTVDLTIDHVTLLEHFHDGQNGREGRRWETFARWRLIGPGA